MTTSHIIVKSYQNGISLQLDDKIDSESLLAEIKAKFAESKEFFGHTQIAISFDGRELSREEEFEIIKTIESASHLKIVSVVGKDGKIEELLKKAGTITKKKPSVSTKSIEHQLIEEKLPDGQFYKGTLRSGQTFESAHNVVICGDVNPGAKVVSGKDIIILGCLFGEAHAGYNNKDKHFIFALEMNPEKMSVGEVKYKGIQVKSIWGVKSKAQPRLAYIKGSQVIIDVATKELLNHLS